VVIFEREVPDLDCTVAGLEQAEPDARRAVVGGNADGAWVVPQQAVDHARERDAAMAADDAVAPCIPDELPEVVVRARTEDELVDPLRAAVDDGEPTPAHQQIDAARQAPHPAAGVLVEHRVGMGVPGGG